MKNHNQTLFHLLIASIMIISATVPMLYQAPTAEAAGEDLHNVDLYLHSDGNGQDYMNSSKEDSPGSGDHTAVTTITWDFGWMQGNNIVDTELKNDIYIKGTYDGLEKFFLWVDVTNPAWDGSIDVTMDLLDENEVVATVTETLDGAPLGGETRTVWEMKFHGNADGTDHHTFIEGNTMKVRMSSPDGNVNVGYQNGDAHVEFQTNQLAEKDEENPEYREFHLEDADGRNMIGKYFTPKLPDRAENREAWIWGLVMDAFTYRDIDVVYVNISHESGGNDITSGEITPEAQGDLVRFDFNWTYGDDLTDTGDAGDYYVDIDYNDLRGNSFLYEEVFKIKITKYGAFIIEHSGESLSKGQKAGNSTEFELDVYNAGLDDDTITLATNLLSGDWEATFDKDTLNLDSGEMKTITLTVDIPDDASPGSRVTVRVTATSDNSKDENDPTYPLTEDDIDCETQVVATAAISIFFKETDSEDDKTDYIDTQHKEGRAEKGISKDFYVRVENDSPGDDKVILDLDDVPSDWDVRILDEDTEQEIDHVNLSADEGVKLIIRVKPATAQGADDVADIVISGYSDNNNNVSDEAFLKVERTLGVVATSADVPSQKVLKPGVPNTIDFIIENTGDEDRTFVLSLDADTIKANNWNAKFKTSNSDSDSIEISAGGSEIISVDVTPPDSAEQTVNDYEMELYVEADDDDDVSYMLTVELNVESTYGIDIIINTREKKIDEAGGKVEFIIRVINTGNSEITINLEVDSEKDDWNLKLNNNADIFAPGEEKDFILTVTAPDPVDNKETNRITITAKILGKPDQSYAEQNIEVKVDKDSTEAFMDTIAEYSWIVALGLVVIVVAVLVYFRSRELDEEEYGNYEDYEDDDEWN